MVLSSFNRRAFVKGSSAAVTAAIWAPPAWGNCTSDPLSGQALFRDVETYSALGDHRTASLGDHATTDWLKWRFQNFGFHVETPQMPFALYEPTDCRLIVGAKQFEGFPAWPVVVTTPEGVQAPLVLASDSDVKNKIAVMSPQYRPGSSLTIPGFGDAVMRLESRGAAGVIIITEGPTGAIIALNAYPARFHWSVPVIQIAGRDGDTVRAMASRGDLANIILNADVQPEATAGNVIARRPGRGKTVVISTPKSGWFTCAGERGSGMAVFLALAQTLADTPETDLMFVATTGHEIQGAGGEHFLKDHAPAPKDVRLWLHIGANIASNSIVMEGGNVVREDTLEERRGLLASSQLLSSARRAFNGQPGYNEPIDVSSDRAVGEVIIYRREGYSPLIGIVGAHPLHHTQLDIPRNVTSPQAIEPVARGMSALVQAALTK